MPVWLACIKYEHNAAFLFLQEFPKRCTYITQQRGKNTLAERKDAFFGKCPFPGKQKERKDMSNNNNNQINVPQAREAMDKFKMQAAQEEDVFSTS